MEQQQYLTVQELAEHFAVTDKTVRNWMKVGVIKSYERVGLRRLRFPVPQVFEEVTAPVK